MSVINKMLRDLDQRQVDQPGSTKAALPGDRATLGTLPVKALQQRPPRSKRLGVAWAAALLVVTLAGGLWYLKSVQRSAAPPVQIAAVHVAPSSLTRQEDARPAIVPADGLLIKAPAPAVSASAVVPVDQKTLVLKAPEPVLTAPKVMAKAVEVKPVPVPKLAPRLMPRAETPVAVVLPDTATGTLRMESSLKRLPAAKKMLPQSAVTARTAVAHPAALDALAQAQSLWNAGSHTAAIELLTQAVNRVQVSTPSGVPVAGQSALPSLVRELARMQLAEGQVGQTLALLKRLEPQLTQIADVWAMRGNAAQRLGQHAEAAQSYQSALALRPDEARWMLGAAVSMAAQGQTDAAGKLTETARSMGALRPEVANYLRQLGVVIRAD